jgi:hypothetical protein
MARNLRGKGVLWVKETRISFEKIPSLWYGVHPMAIQKRTAFSRRLPDLVTEELAAVLSSRSSFEFKDLFEKVYERLKARNAASGGEEMLRLRAYEKLQNLVSRGMVKKDVKKYKGIPKQLATLQTTPPPLPAPQPVEV